MRYIKNLKLYTGSNLTSGYMLSKTHLGVFSLIFAGIGGYMLIGSKAAVVCNLNATTANFASQVAAATAGQTVCLASGSYGTWNGTDKAITITKQDGASVTMALNFGTGDKDFTVDGLTITSGSVAGNGTYTFHSNTPHNITIKNSTFTGMINIDYVINDGSWPFTILLDGNTHNNIDYNGGRIRLPYDNNEVNSGVIIQNSVLRGGAADGVQSGAGVTILNNEFDNVEEGAFEEYHTDSIQVFGRGAARTIVRGNWIHNGADGFTAYDGLGNAIIENNVIHADSVNRCLEIYYDNAGPGSDSSIVRHNTLYGGCTIDLNTKPGTYPGGTGTIVEDNIVPGGVGQNNGSTAAVNRKNMCQSSCGANNFVGIASFVGGGSPTSHDGFLLASGLPGKNAASDGTDVGIYALGTGSGGSGGSSKTGDLNADNLVNIFDLSILLSNYGKPQSQSTNSKTDFNTDGTINIFDLSILLSNYGK